MTAAANPPAFILAGDSTTAVQSTGGGGWGNGFISFLNSPAWGVNKGHNGATTKSFVDGGDWSVVTGLVSESIASYDTYVTIQFGHNDQKNTSGLTLEQYQTNLVNLANEIWELGATPILLTPLTRRNFASAHNATDSLASERVATIAAASASNTTYLDLNAASLSYINSIGEATAHTYNLYPDDNTHLNSWGSIVFGRIVADLLLEEKPALAAWISANETMSELIRDGLPA
ncbi:SGNH hydrolase-type esterase domain-containing protein [Xylaria bambusicola]|uniref:SGNH hydrolase-type esterase domain-containing protein n=1 Tax=Xylaria bambusicola TaxID=326684 RepID=UPI002008DBBC|nr:SGNH hydrolase-type esterase domain-containing protein [Xylaria bambusicola]KAI0509010.1 SGNH hydrolase-type esterase domain-containing protein [Xylaria bambusicola]